MSWERTIALTSSDGMVLHVEEAVVFESPALMDFIKENSVSKSSLIAINDVNTTTLEAVMDYCRLQAEARRPDGVIMGPDYAESLTCLGAQLVDVDPVTLFHLIHASDKLKIKSLMDLACKTFGKKIKKSIDGSSSNEGTDGSSSNEWP